MRLAKSGRAWQVMKTSMKCQRTATAKDQSEHKKHWRKPRQQHTHSTSPSRTLRGTEHQPDARMSMRLRTEFCTTWRTPLTAGRRKFEDDARRPRRSCESPVVEGRSCNIGEKRSFNGAMLAVMTGMTPTSTVTTLHRYAKPQVMLMVEGNGHLRRVKLTLLMEDESSSLECEPKIPSRR